MRGYYLIMEYYTKDEVNQLLTQLKTELIAEIKNTEDEIKQSLNTQGR